MAVEYREVQSLPLYQILGAPLLAIVQGQAQAAQTTAEFIERIGFKTKTGEGEAEVKEDELGDLRMVTFRYQKPGPDGDLAKYQADIPLLSMVPIPAIQIKDADIEFNVKITDVQSSDTKLSLSSEDAQAGEWLSKGRVEFRASMGKMEAGISEKRTTEFQMKVKMTVEQADIPAGLSFLFRLMDQSISSSAIEELPT